ncbi:MAG: zinc ribbon domain-containing protein [Chloroflexi bacterium]|nr:zinc ribbon domain-containing protein [Chloroflexota bacterium]
MPNARMAGGSSKAAKPKMKGNAGGVSPESAMKTEYCTQCGEPLAPGSYFCGACGAKVKKT